MELFTQCEIVNKHLNAAFFKFKIFFFSFVLRYFLYHANFSLAISDYNWILIFTIWSLYSRHNMFVVQVFVFFFFFARSCCGCYWFCCCFRSFFFHFCAREHINVVPMCVWSWYVLLCHIFIHYTHVSNVYLYCRSLAWTKGK